MEDRLNIIKNSSLHYRNDFYKSNENIINYTREKFGFRGDYNNVNNIDIPLQLVEALQIKDILQMEKLGKT